MLKLELEKMHSPEGTIDSDAGQFNDQKLLKCVNEFKRSKEKKLNIRVFESVREKGNSLMGISQRKLDN